MNAKDGKFQNIIPTVIIVSLAVFSFVLYLNDREREESALDSFAESRMELASLGLSGFRKEIDEKYSILFPDCKEQSQYDKYIDSDSRTMTAFELRDALRIHSICGMDLTKKTRLTLDAFSSEIEKLDQISLFLKDSKNSKNASQIVKFWNNILNLELEHAEIYERLVNIQQEYWEADLNKVTQVDTPAEREEKVGTLNYEAVEKLERISQIREEIERYKTAESTLWQDFFMEVAKD